MPTRCNRRFLLQILLLAQQVSGTIMRIIRSSRVLYKWLLPVVFGALVFKLSVWCGAPHHTDNLKTKYDRQHHLYNTLELLMMGIMVPETCWASNKICNKNRLLHPVGILFPHAIRMFLNTTPFFYKNVSWRYDASFKIFRPTLILELYNGSLRWENAYWTSRSKLYLLIACDIYNQWTWVCVCFITAAHFEELQSFYLSHHCQSCQLSVFIIVKNDK